MLDTSSTSTYSLDEVAALAPPSEMKNSPRRLADRSPGRLGRGQILPSRHRDYRSILR